jgi:hypothetical protein
LVTWAFTEKNPRKNRMRKCPFCNFKVMFGRYMKRYFKLDKKKRIEYISTDSPGKQKDGDT